MNKVILKGNVGGNPEVKTFDWGKVCKFSLATSESYKNKENEKVTDTTWHNLVFRGPVCDTLEKFVHKGDQLLVEGKIIVRKYQDRNQVDRWTTEIICNSFEFCGTKEEKKEEPRESNNAQDDPSWDYGK